MSLKCAPRNSYRNIKVMASSIKFLFISLCLFLGGHGVSQTLVPVHASFVGWSERDISIIGSAYFFGFVIGCLTVPKLLTRVGHVRVFLTLAWITSASILMLRDLQDVSIWVGLRLIDSTD